MNKRLRIAALLAGLVIVAAACTGGGTTTTPEASTGGGASAAPGASEVAPSEAAFPTADVKFVVWTKEGEADGGLQYVTKLTDAYTKLHPNVTFEITNKDVEALREDFQTASLAGDAADLLWTVADHIGPFTAADLILPLNDMVDAATYVPQASEIVTVDGTLWGAPLSFGNQLMLYWNKELAGDTAPADSTAWVDQAKTLTTGDQFGIVFNQTESFWLVPFLGGYGGNVFAEDGVTPTLNTQPMQQALQFLYDLKFTDKVTPAEADYNVADGLFKDGKAPYIINGDWTLGTYAETFPDNLGVGPIPQLTGAEYPKPYIAGAFWMVAKTVGDDADKKTIAADFLQWSTDQENQVDMVKTLRRLPGNAEALADPIVTDDPLLAGSADAATKGIPQPTNLEMRCIFDSMNAGVRDMFTGNSDVAGISNTMQTSAEACIAAL
jgi:arabinogalactan oligomer/maltooligosaccharide transport system substrate-binding protein